MHMYHRHTNTFKRSHAPSCEPRWMSANRCGLRPIWKGKTLGPVIDTSQIRSNNCVFVRACHTGPFMGAIWGFEVEWMSDPKMDCFPYEVWLSHLEFQYKRNEPITARWWGFTPDRQRDTIASTGMTCKKHTHMHILHTWTWHILMWLHIQTILLTTHKKTWKNWQAHTCFHFT